jgi:hypothetical protein
VIHPLIAIAVTLATLVAGFFAFLWVVTQVERDGERSEGRDDPGSGRDHGHSGDDRGGES